MNGRSSIRSEPSMWDAPCGCEKRTTTPVADAPPKFEKENSARMVSPGPAERAGSRTSVRSPSTNAGDPGAKIPVSELPGTQGSF